MPLTACCLPLLYPLFSASELGERCMLCRVFTGVKTASHKDLQLFPRGSARMRDCLQTVLDTAPAGVSVAGALPVLKDRCVKLYNVDVITKHDGTYRFCFRYRSTLPKVCLLFLCTVAPVMFGNPLLNNVLKIELVQLKK